MKRTEWMMTILENGSAMGFCKFSCVSLVDGSF